MLISKIRNCFLVLSLLEGLNYLLTGPYLSDKIIYEEYVANSLIIAGMCLLTIQNLNKVVLLGLIITWIGFIELFFITDIDLFENGWIKRIFVIKMFFVKTLIYWIGFVSICILAKSIYYDGILLILSIFNKTNQELTNSQISNV